jgi:hypothetical protein
MVRRMKKYNGHRKEASNGLLEVQLDLPGVTQQNQKHSVRIVRAENLGRSHMKQSAACSTMPFNDLQFYFSNSSYSTILDNLSLF